MQLSSFILRGTWLGVALRRAHTSKDPSKVEKLPGRKIFHNPLRIFHGNGRTQNIQEIARENVTFPVLEVLTEILARDSPRRNSCISREDLSQHCRFSAALVTAQHGVCLQETDTGLERKHSCLRSRSKF